MNIPDLRPLSLSELLDRVFTYYRRRFWLFVGIMAIPQAFVVALNILVEGLQQVAREMPDIVRAGASILSSPAGVAGMVAGVTFFVVGLLLVSAYAMGAGVFAVSEVHLGRNTTIRASYQWMKGRLWRLVGLFIAITIRMIGVGVLFAGGIAGIILGAREFGTSNLISALSITLGILAVFASSILWVMLALRYSLSASVLLLERVNAGEAIRRSVLLARGNLGRIFLLLLLMSMVSWAASALCQGPFLVAVMVFAIKNQGVVPLWVNVPTYIAGGIGQALTAPLIMIGLVLLYYDARVRKEGFDLQLIMDSLDQRKDQPSAP